MHHIPASRKGAGAFPQNQLIFLYMISFKEFKDVFYKLEYDVPVYMFQQVVGYRKKGETVMFQGKENGVYLYC
jgi:hypothetical protein